MLQKLNAYLLAKIGADTAEHEQHFAEILPKIGNNPTGPQAAERLWPGARRSSAGTVAIAQADPRASLN